MKLYKTFLISLMILMLGSLTSCDGQKQDKIPIIPSASQQITPIPTPSPIEFSKIEEKVIVEPLVIKEEKKVVEKEEKPLSKQNIQANIINIASKYIGEFESEGSNNSPFIRKINKFAGVPPQSYWCASFVNYVYYEAGVKNRPKASAYSPSWFIGKYLISFNDLQKGDTVGFYFPKLDGGRIGHIAIYTGSETATKMRFIEGNTSPDAETGELSRNGGNSGGVYSKLRSKKLLNNGKNKFSRWY